MVCKRTATYVKYTCMVQNNDFANTYTCGFNTSKTEENSIDLKTKQTKNKNVCLARRRFTAWSRPNFV